MMRIMLAAFALSLSFVSARADEGKGMDPETMMKAMQQAGTPGAEHKKLDVFVGTWDYTAKMWMDPTKSPMTSKGTSERKWVLGGRFIHETCKGTCEKGMDFEGFGVLGYDNTRKKYTSGWVDSMSTGVCTSLGTIDESGKKIEFSGNEICPVTKEPCKTRTVCTIESNDKLVMEMFVSMSGKEMKCFEITYTRKTSK